MGSLKDHSGPLYPILIHHAGRPSLKRYYSRFRGGPPGLYGKGYPKGKKTAAPQTAVRLFRGWPAYRVYTGRAWWAGVARPQGGWPLAVSCPLGHPTSSASGTRFKLSPVFISLHILYSEVREMTFRLEIGDPPVGPGDPTVRQTMLINNITN
jgi:hypothetical protein